VAQHPWHDAGIELDNPASAKEAIEAAGLDYTVVRRPMGEFVGRKHFDDVPDRWVTVRTDTGDVLGIVENGYEPVQNRDAFASLDNLIGSGEMIYETAGIIGRGERIWILARLPGYITVNGKDIVDKYLLLSNSHAGSQTARVKTLPIRVVCNNTLTAALQGAGDVCVRQDVRAPEDQALSLLRLTHRLYEKLDACFNRMALTKISDDQLLEYVTALVQDDAGGEDVVTIRGIRNKCLELYESGQGAGLSRGTLWGAFNCVTEYTDHVMEGDPSARLESIWFGGGDRLKVKAFQLAERMM
jgi:phage/plasmid-like protein (TIGR03299 family)